MTPSSESPFGFSTIDTKKSLTELLKVSNSISEEVGAPASVICNVLCNPKALIPPPLRTILDIHVHVY